MNRKTLIQSLEEAGLAAYIDNLKPLIKTAIRAMPTAVKDEDEIPVGTSKLGGRPDLPVGGQWPAVNDVPLLFIGQFQLQEIAPLDNTGLLPETGLLSFFHDGLFVGQEKPHCRVFYDDGPAENLRRVGRPQNAYREDFYLFRACQLEFTTTVNLPPAVEINDSFFPIITPVHFATSEEKQAYQSLRRKLWDPGTQFLGNVVEIQGGEEKLYAIQKQYPQRYSYEDYDFQNKEELIQKMKDLILLLTVASEFEADMSWGDNGLIYFWIEEADLLAGRWDQVFSTLTSA